MFQKKKFIKKFLRASDEKIILYIFFLRETKNYFFLEQQARIFSPFLKKYSHENFFAPSISAEKSDWLFRAT